MTGSKAWPWKCSPVTRGCYQGTGGQAEAGRVTAREVLSESPPSSSESILSPVLGCCVCAPGNREGGGEDLPGICGLQDFRIGANTL